MELLSLINQKINSFVWGPVMLILLVGTGIFLTIATKCFQISHIAVWVKSTFGSLTKKQKQTDNITPFQAVTTALASTVGTGNIAGVATAIVSGGPGAIFWMWLSAFFGMMTKYAEVVLAVKFREKDKNGIHYGGPMYYLEKGLRLKWLAVIFSVFGIFATFGIGNMAQVNSLSTVLYANFGVPLFVSGIVVAIFVSLVIIGGIKRIARVTEMIVPIMAIFYFVGSVIVLLINFNKIHSAFMTIFESAFSFKSLGGGVMGYAVMRAMRYGIARGVFSNEAGLGSAPMAHAASNINNPVKQGLWGIFEVFVDTIVICSLTALVVLTSGLYANTNLEGAALTSAAFSSALSSFGGKFVAISVIFFAFSTIIGWSYYGENCMKYLFKNNVIPRIYKVIFICVIIIGANMKLALAWDISDTFNGLMAMPNLIGILLLSGTVIELTKKYIKDPSSLDMKD